MPSTCSPRSTRFTPTSFDHRPVDVGNKLDYLKATMEFALERADVGEDLPHLPAGTSWSAGCWTSPARALSEPVHGRRVDCPHGRTPPRARSRRHRRASLSVDDARERVLSQIHPARATSAPRSPRRSDAWLPRTRWPIGTFRSSRPRRWMASRSAPPMWPAQRPITPST